MLIADEKLTTPTVRFSVSGKSPVVALAMLNNELFVSREPLAEVSVYDKESCKFQRKISPPDFGSSLFGLATCNTNICLYVSDYTSDVIHKIDVSKSTGTTITKWSVASGPCGLSVNGAHNVLLASWRGRKIQEYTHSGSLIREIPDNGGPWQAVELNSGNMVVSRSGSVHGVYVMTLQGKIVYNFGGKPGSRTGQIDAPRSLTVSKEDFVLVTDSDNNRILVLNPSLTQVHPLPLNVDGGLQRPFGLCYEQSCGRLYIGECGGQSRLLVFDNVRGLRGLFKS